MAPVAGPTEQRLRLPGVTDVLRIVWDRHGFVHVFAASVEDAYAGFGWVAGHERLWQIHITTLYATGMAASVLGPRFAAQDALVRTLDVPGNRVVRPRSAGDSLAEAFLAGLNACIDQLDAPPPEFDIADTTPRHFTLDDLAARHRFASYHQHKPIMEKLLLARLVSAHGAQQWQAHSNHFTQDDLRLARDLAEPYSRLSLALGPLLHPTAKRFEPGSTAPQAGGGTPWASNSGSNNWAVRGRHSASGKPLLASDPHQPHSIPNTFFYAHLSAPGLEVIGASFPGMPVFPMGHTRDIAWGLTTGFVDCCDIYVERLNAARDAYRHGDQWRSLRHETIEIGRKGEAALCVPLVMSHHGPLLEPMLEACGLAPARGDDFATAIRWSVGELAIAGGALARLPLANTADEFGAALFDNGVTPLVNNLICVDRHDGIARWVAATLPKRTGASGVLPLPGWDTRYDFPLSEPHEVCFDRDTAAGYLVTANNDTLGTATPFPIHNFHALSSRAERIAELLAARTGWTAAAFARMQNDLVDVNARTHVPPLAALLEEATHPDALLVARLLGEWRTYESNVDAVGPTVWHALTDSQWPLRFMHAALLAQGLDVSMLPELPFAPGLIRWNVTDFLDARSGFHGCRGLLVSTLEVAAVRVAARLRDLLGADPAHWQYGRARRIAIAHTQQARHAAFARLRVGPEAIGGSATTIAMAMHLADDSGEALWRVVHGPAFRFVVDLAEPTHSHWVIAGGNSARPDSAHVTDQFAHWLAGELLTVELGRDAVIAAAERVIRFEP